MEQQAFLGVSSIKELLPTLQKYSPRHIFLVRGKKSYVACGAKAIIDDVLDVLHCSVTEYCDFEENPKIEDLERGLELLRHSQASMIVAVGGGSVLDMSKLLRFFYSYSGEVTGTEFKKECELLPLIALPTTAGTGSEATHFAVLYKDKVKYSVEHDDILPDVAIVYPPFTYSNPKYLTACTGFDALAQGIEAYWNVNATAESDEYAEKAIRLLWSNLPLAVNSPTEDIRNLVSEGSYWAGRAINITKTTAPHAFSYPLTIYYGYPHGHALALIFPSIFEYNIQNVISNKGKMKLKCLSSFCDNISLVDSYNEFYKYIRNIQLDKIYNNTLNDIEIHRLVRNIGLNRLKNNPAMINNSNIEGLFKKSLVNGKL